MAVENDVPNETLRDNVKIKGASFPASEAYIELRLLTAEQ